MIKKKWLWKAFEYARIKNALHKFNLSSIYQFKITRLLQKGYCFLLHSQNKFLFLQESLVSNMEVREAIFKDFFAIYATHMYTGDFS